MSPKLMLINSAVSQVISCASKNDISTQKTLKTWNSDGGVIYHQRTVSGKNNINIAGMSIYCPREKQNNTFVYLFLNNKAKHSAYNARTGMVLSNTNKFILCRKNIKSVFIWRLFLNEFLSYKRLHKNST